MPVKHTAQTLNALAASGTKDELSTAALVKSLNDRLAKSLEAVEQRHAARNSRPGADATQSAVATTSRDGESDDDSDDEQAEPNAAAANNNSDDAEAAAAAPRTTTAGDEDVDYEA